MAQTLQNTIISLMTILSLFILNVAAYETNDKYYKSLSPEELGLQKKEELTHLHFYFHDILSGPNPTTVPVAAAQTTNTSSTGFGFTVVIDDPLTEGPEPNSTAVGRAQGIYASASQSEVGLLMVLNYVFTQGKFNGSTLSILGRSASFTGVSEMPIVGGSGLFRFARGYARAETVKFNVISGDSIVEYNVYVSH